MHGRIWNALSAISQFPRNNAYISQNFKNCCIYKMSETQCGDGETFGSFIIFEQSKGQKVSHKTSIKQMHQNLTAMFLGTHLDKLGIRFHN